jgi:membrane fusion protein, copper/silver efflux system
MNKKLVIALFALIVILIITAMNMPKWTGINKLSGMKCTDAGMKAVCACADHVFMAKDGLYKKCPICGKELKSGMPMTREEMKSGAMSSAAAKGKKTEGQILYYRNPMNPKITSKVPAKDQMGMDYIPVYEEVKSTSETPQSEEYISKLELGPEMIKRAGVKTIKAEKHRLFKTIRTVGVIAYDPELAVAQEEFLTAVETRDKVAKSTDPDVISRADDLLNKSRFKLRLLGMSDDEIDNLKNKGRAEMNLVLPSDKAWIYADVYEYELSWVKPGQEVTIIATAYPGEKFSGTVKSISPVINQKTRAARVRIEADNAQGKLQPKMYADVIIKSSYTLPDGSSEALAIPLDSIIDTGERKIAYVAKGPGEFYGREITTGPEAVARIDGKDVKVYPVLSGIDQGDAVVTGGNFLIDSQSQISGVASSAYGGALGKKQ